MERKLFTWTGWDEIAVGHLQFYEVELLQDIGPHKTGDKFPVADIDFQSGRLSLYGETDAKTGVPTTVVGLELMVQS